MKVLLVNTVDRGGAANACLRLHEGLIKHKVNADVLLLKKTKHNAHYYQYKDPNPPNKNHSLFFRVLRRLKLKLTALGIIKVDKKEQELQRYKSFQKTRNKNLEAFNYPVCDFDITKIDNYQNAEIINLHWVAGFLDYSTFFKKNSKPVVWTLHDMHPFLGGEHYNEEYIGVAENGEPKPRLVSNEEKEMFKKLLQIKAKALENCNNLHIVTLCKWMTDEVKKSKLFSKYPVYQIPNGINEQIFKPRNVDFSRELLGIPKNKKVILFAANSVTNSRKGFVFLLEALKRIKSDNFVLVAAGKSNDEMNSIDNLISLGSINDERLMSAVYSSADVFVIPSLMDNLPNTVIESLLCGTPVIGFPIGGIPDMIQHNENGFLTKEVNVSSLADTINMFLHEPNSFNSEKIRENAILKYSLNVQVKNYMDLFENIAKESNL